MMKRDRHLSTISVTIMLMRTALPIESKAIFLESTDEPPRRKASKLAIVNQAHAQRVTVTRGSEDTLTSSLGSVGMGSLCLSMLSKTNWTTS